MVNRRSNVDGALYLGVGDAYKLLRMNDDMDGARSSIIHLLREAADLIEKRRISPDGTPLDSSEDGDLFE